MCRWVGWRKDSLALSTDTLLFLLGCEVGRGSERSPATGEIYMGVFTIFIFSHQLVILNRYCIQLILNIFVFHPASEISLLKSFIPRHFSSAFPVQGAFLGVCSGCCR